ncbi:hypothetical protein A1Q2_03877 [Trichosporon asahii var. asahii CBS 8904]|uniref:Uncharacterized protein n=2 Tax=Trichosporon asahii var. asahii TaxID=189963 RepID=K1WKI2_TRIAC|nr:hypothetical protein A1Q1_08205 [Trichosporon asahii var. asahii CBS 2479]EJT50653.1 hypothetical protein A1Q1_08205 [Trichosporon asahii var. asahii CBS 2479]EKD01814.1 hypothetical protein A1Q2_03877 [Trichosporon asahii var. asahii CBS 8904]
MDSEDDEADSEEDSAEDDALAEAVCEGMEEAGDEDASVLIEKSEDVLVAEELSELAVPLVVVVALSVLGEEDGGGEDVPPKAHPLAIGILGP